MKIISLNVLNFGKLSNFHMDFVDGINEIHAKNGFGKTTLAHFIKAMFYGLDSSTKKDLDENERRKYMPWNDLKFGGNLDFVLNNKKYRIERFFYKQAKNDTFRCIDLDTNLDSSFTNQLGEEIFKMDEDSFIKCIYIENNLKEYSLTDSLREELTNMLESSSNSGSYEEAYKSITKERFPYLKKGNKGLLPDEINKCEELIREKNNLQSAISNILLLKEKKDSLTKKDDEIKNRCDKLNECIKRKTIQKTRMDSLAYYNKQKQEIMRMSNLLNEKKNKERKRLNKEELDILKEKISEYQIERASLLKYNNDELLSLESYFDGKIIDDNILDCYSKKIEEYYSLSNLDESTIDVLYLEEVIENSRKKYPLIFISGFTFFVSLVFLILYLSIKMNLYIYLFGGFTILSLVFLLAFIIIFRKEKSLINKLDLYSSIKEIKDQYNKITKMEEEKEIKKARKEELKNDIDEFFKNFKGTRDISYLPLLSEIKEKKALFTSLLLANKAHQEALYELKQRESELINEFKFYSFFKIDEKPDILFKKALLFDEEINHDEMILNEKMKNLDEYKVAQQINENEVFDNTDYDSLLKNAIDEEKAIALEIHKIDEEINRLELKREDIKTLEENIEDSKSIIKKYEHKVEVFDKTLEMLLLSKNNIAQNYVRPIKSTLKNLLFKFIPDLDIHLTPELSFNYESLGQMREFKTLSKGYRDLVSILIRIAIIKELFKKEKPFIIFDDAFANLDSDNMEKIKEILNSLEEEYQIIYMNCH